jgi:hypothetical protein
MRIKLEKLLEVQTVQVDLQKELRVKTESLLQVEQQQTSKLRLQVEQARISPGSEMESRRKIEERLVEAQEHIKKLEKQMTEASAPETSDRVESQLRVQVEEKENLIERLTQQLDAQGGLSTPAPQGEPVRLQLLLQARDKHIDEITQGLRKAQNDAAEFQSEADVLKHQLRVMRKEVTERTDEMERQLNAERSCRAEVFQLQAKLEQLHGQYQEEARRASEYSQRAAEADELQARVSQLEAQLAEEQTTSKCSRDQVLAEAEYRVQAKEQVIKHQTAAITSLNTELKEKQDEIAKLVRSGADAVTTPKADAAREKGGLLPPIASPRGALAEDMQSQRSMESLHRQLKSKDVKIGKQAERIQTLTEMLEKRDQQVDELSSAKRDRETMRQRVTDMEETLKAQPRASTHAEAERRLIDQEQRMRETERRAQKLDGLLSEERGEKETLQRELLSLKGHLTEGGSSTEKLQEENSRLSRELAEARRVLEGRSEELRRVRESRPLPAEPEVARPTSLPALQKRLHKFEELDQQLGRDVAVMLQERENKIESLNSTVTLLRNTVDELRRAKAPDTGMAAREQVASADIGMSAETPSAIARTQVASAAAVTSETNTERQRPTPLGTPGTRATPTRAFARDTAHSPVPPEMATDDVRQELLTRRQEGSQYEQQLAEKQQLIMKLIEEANLCNAEVASLQQTVQQAHKQARKRDKELEQLQDERDKFEN